MPEMSKNQRYWDRRLQPAYSIILLSLLTVSTSQNLSDTTVAELANATLVGDLSEEEQQLLIKNVTTVLERMLDGYDDKLTPNFDVSTPTTILIDINVRSMGPISELDMTYSMDCYFRQTWVDRRLAFDPPWPNMNSLSVHIKMLEKMWKPDTYFYNGQQSYLHTITTPNKFVRIKRNGEVLYSSRLTIKASCPMKLTSFPLDSQECLLMMGSFGYSSKDIVYKWKWKDESVVTAKDMKLSQFDLTSTPVSNYTYVFQNNEFSMLKVHFHLKRHAGYFVIQIYVPCSLIVMLSWVGFWINREATADRITLGITTVLTMAFLTLESRHGLPKVSYVTAIDMFMGMCFTYVSASVIQVAIVHYFTKYGTSEINEKQHHQQQQQHVDDKTATDSTTVPATYDVPNDADTNDDGDDDYDADDDDDHASSRRNIVETIGDSEEIQGLRNTRRANGDPKIQLNAVGYGKANTSGGGGSWWQRVVRRMAAATCSDGGSCCGLGMGRQRRRQQRAGSGRLDPQKARSTTLEQMQKMGYHNSARVQPM